MSEALRSVVWYSTFDGGDPGRFLTRLLVVEAQDRLAFGVELAPDVLAHTTAAHFRDGALRVRLAGDDAATDPFLRVAAQEAGVGACWEPGHFHARQEAALSVRATADIQALTSLAGFEDSAVSVTFAGGLTASGDAAPVERAVRAASTLDARSVLTKGRCAEALCVVLAISWQHAARVFAGKVTELLAVGIRAHWVRWLVGRVAAVTRSADADVGVAFRVGGASRKVEHAGAVDAQVVQAIRVTRTLTPRDRAPSATRAASGTLGRTGAGFAHAAR